MKILPIAPGFSADTVFSGKRKAAHSTFSTDEANFDTFSKREDNYTKRYKELLKEAYKAQDGRTDARACLNTSDIDFLLDIKDYEKFKGIITAPVEIEYRSRNEEVNIFHYTDHNATRKLIKKLNDKDALKKLLLQGRGYNEDTVFHSIARSNDMKKAKVLQESLSKKEFKKFMTAKNWRGETPYSIAQENNDTLKAFLEPLLADVI